MPLFGPPNIKKLIKTRNISGLKNLLRNKEPKIVTEAAFALAEFGGYSQELLIVAVTDEDVSIRAKAITLLSRFIYLGFIPIITSLHDSEELVRLCGIMGLMERREKRAIIPLANCLRKDPSKQVRSVAITALFHIGGRDAIEYLIIGRNDPNEDVRNTANSCLEKLGYGLEARNENKPPGENIKLDKEMLELKNIKQKWGNYPVDENVKNTCDQKAQPIAEVLFNLGKSCINFGLIRDLDDYSLRKDVIDACKELSYGAFFVGMEYPEESASKYLSPQSKVYKLLEVNEEQVENLVILFMSTLVDGGCRWWEIKR